MKRCNFRVSCFLIASCTSGTFFFRHSVVVIGIVLLNAIQSARFTIIIRPHRSTMYIDAAYCYGPNSIVQQSVTLVSLEKTTQLIEMLFGLRTQVGQSNHVLAVHTAMGMRNFDRGRGGPL